MKQPNKFVVLDTDGTILSTTIHRNDAFSDAREMASRAPGSRFKVYEKIGEAWSRVVVDDDRPKPAREEVSP